MSKKLLLGVILCVGLQAINAADQAQAPVRTSTAYQAEACKNFKAIGTNAFEAWKGAGGTIKNAYLTGKHTGLFLFAYSRETAAQVAEIAANAGKCAKEAAVKIGTTVWNSTEAARRNPGTTIATVTAGGLGLYYTPRWIWMKVAEYAPVIALTAAAVKAMEHRNTASSQS